MQSRQLVWAKPSASSIVNSACSLCLPNSTGSDSHQAAEISRASTGPCAEPLPHQLHDVKGFRGMQGQHGMSREAWPQCV